MGTHIRRNRKWMLNVPLSPKNERMSNIAPIKIELKSAQRKYFCPFFFDIISEAENALM